MRRQVGLQLLVIWAASASAAQTAMFRGGPEHLGNYAGPVPTLDSVAWSSSRDGTDTSMR